jgi:hypothetical protein
MSARYLALMPIQWPKGDREHAGPGERREERVQDPHPEQNQSDGKYDPRDTLGVRQALGFDTPR